MKKFLVLYHAPVSASQQMANATPEQAKAGMDAWMNWAKKAGSAIVDLGLPLANGKSISQSTVNDSGATIVGYSILQADSVDDVTKLLKEHPHLNMPGFSIDVFEGIPIPGM